MIQCYFGNGKGKTTASVGACIRYLGCNKRVLFVSFLKDGTSSELEILRKLPGVTVLIPAVSYHLFDNRNVDKQEELSTAYTQFFSENLAESPACFDMIVLDEILDVLDFGYIPEAMVSEFLKIHGQATEFVLTGHRLPHKISEICDYISEIHSAKHPFEKGIASRKGIEY